MKKDFDCVEMKRKGQAALRKRLAGMTREQELAFWAKSTDALAKRLAAAKAKNLKRPA